MTEVMSTTLPVRGMERVAPTAETQKQTRSRSHPGEGVGRCLGRRTSGNGCLGDGTMANSRPGSVRTVARAGGAEREIQVHGMWRRTPMLGPCDIVACRRDRLQLRTIQIARISSNLISAYLLVLQVCEDCGGTKQSLLNGSLAFHACTFSLPMHL